MSLTQTQNVYGCASTDVVKVTETVCSCSAYRQFIQPCLTDRSAQRPDELLIYASSFRALITPLPSSVHTRTHTHTRTSKGIDSPASQRRPLLLITTECFRLTSSHTQPPELTSAAEERGRTASSSRREQQQQTYSGAVSGGSAGHSGGAFQSNSWDTPPSLLPRYRRKNAPPTPQKSTPTSLLIQSHLQQSPLSSSLVVMNSL